MPPPALELESRFLRQLESLALSARKLSSGRERGERKSTQVGSGIAFATHRPYAAGDDFRFLDWKAFARSERLYVRQHEEERDLSVQLLLDCSASMAHASGAKFHFAQQLSAALGYIALVNLDRVAVQAYADAPGAALGPLRGRARALVLLRFLQRLAPAGRTDLARAAQAVCARAARGGLALVLSDGYDADDLLRGIDRLRYGKFETTVLRISDPREAQPALGGELTLVDAESGEERTLTVTARLLSRYRELHHAHAQALRRALAQRQVRLVELSVDVPLERSVLTLLRGAGVVG